jgi:hypothetical protein
MNPPVSNGVQGAFFVAAFVTGVIFGILSLVFADLTEGFGCLLGGFCLSMWFLSLKDGGLISSATGRAIFIGCMSAGGYSLSFSHYTRSYGLIASISLSGGTITILGIDCLSCAGWKEFWLYLWALNDDIFPLNTNTYPVTRNMKAELAGVIVIAVFGVVSQLRVWNLVKDRRAKNVAQELEEQQEKDREEEARGRTVEDKFQKERAQWEAAYGNGIGNKSSIPDSSVRSSFASPKGSSSIQEKDICGVDSMEMVDLNSKTGLASNGNTVTVRALPDDDIHQIDAQGNPTDTPTQDRPISKRVSNTAATKRYSTRASKVISQSAEALVQDPHADDDRASSVAATLDDDHDNVSIRQLSPQSSFADAKSAPVVAEDSRDSVPVTESAPVRPALRHSLTSSTDPKPNSRPRIDTAVASSASGSDQSPQSGSPALNAPSQALHTEHAESHVGSLKDDAFPQRLSKVALSYRTDEWAKHLEAADTPDLDDLQSPVSPTIRVEMAAPVSDEIAAPLMVTKRDSRRVSSGGNSARSMAPSPAIASSGVLSRSNSTNELDRLSPLPSNTLLGQRESLMRKRTSSQSFTPKTSVGNLLEQADEEEMSLAQRRQALQHHQSSTPVIQRQSSTPGLQRQSSTPGLQHQISATSQRKSPPSSSQKWQDKKWATKGAPLGFDSHQPRRTTSNQSDQKREQLYAGWRNNIQDVTIPQTQAYIAEQQRVALLNERRQKEAEKQQREAKQQQRASQLDSMMRSGHMLDAHREAMRKMQANATRNAS